MIESQSLAFSLAAGIQWQALPGFHSLLSAPEVC